MRPIEPPPSIVKLVPNDIQSESIWKTWLNNLHRFITDLASEVALSTTNKTLLNNQITSQRFQSDKYSFIYSINSDLWDLNDNFGTAVVDNHRLKISTSAANSSAGLFGRRKVAYNSGIDNTVLFDSAFTTGAAGSTQIVGVGDISDGFGFGFKGTDFGVFRVAYGHSEYQELTITTGSSTSESVTINLDGNIVLVPVSNSGNATITANEIAAFDYSNVGSGWNAFSINNIVEFRSFRAIDFVGAFTLSAITAIGAFSQDLAGVAPTIEFIKSSDFDKNIIIDRNLLNNFKINYQWGTGICDFYIQNPDSFEYEKVHTISNVNNSLFPIINNPNLPLFYFVENSTNNTEIAIYSTNISAYSNGEQSGTGVNHVAIEDKLVNNTTLPVLSLVNPYLYKTFPNRIRSIFNSISITTSLNSGSNKSVIISLYKNAKIVDSDFKEIGTNTPIMSDIAGTDFSGGELIFSDVLGSSDSVRIPVSNNAFLSEGETITVVANTQSNVNVGVVFIFEDNI